MKIGLFSTNNYIQSTLKNSSKNISFGEFDGDYYDSPRLTKSQYEVKKEAINDKYDSKRSSYLSDADDLEFSNSVVWDQLKRIEKMRDFELRQLDSDYNY